MRNNTAFAPYTKNYFAIQQEADEGSGDVGLVCRTVPVGKTRTSIRIEPEIWDAIQFIIRNEKTTQAEMFETIKSCKRKGSSFSSAIRVFAMLYFRAAATNEGHKLAGHGDITMMKRRISPQKRKEIFSSEEN